MPDKLPKGWVKTTLSDIARTTSGGTPRRDRSHLYGGNIPWVKSGELRDGVVYETEETIPEEALESSNAKVFPKGTLCIALYGATVGKLGFLGIDAATNQAVCAIFPWAGVNNRYLYYFLLGKRRDLVEQSQGGAQPNISQQIIRDTMIPLAPTREQERIVAKLDAVLSRVAAGEAAARRALGRLKKYRAAVLHAAVTGELTRDWRKAHKPDETSSQLLDRILRGRRAEWERIQLNRFQASGGEPKDEKWKARYRDPQPLQADGLPRLPATWTHAAVEQVGLVQLGRQRAPVHHTGKFMRPYLRVANVFDDRINLSDVKEMNFTPEEFEVYRLHPNDILLNEGQSLELVGRAAMFRDEIAGACFQNTLVRFRPSKPLNPAYALTVFRAYRWSGRFQKIAKWTTNIAHLGADRFARLEFPLPPLAEQSEIVREVERCLSASDRLAITLNRQLERGRTTRQSLLREAFAGHLVPQDPNDEPASVLLDRIRAASDAEMTKPKVKRMPKSKTKPAKRPLLQVLREHKKPMTVENLFRESGYESLLSESDEPQDVVDAFYGELREHTAKPAKISQQRDSKGQALLRALS